MVIKNENGPEQRLGQFTSATSLPFSIENRYRCCCNMSSLTFEEPKPPELADMSKEEWQEFSTKLNEVAKTSPPIPNGCAFACSVLSTVVLSFVASYFFFTVIGPDDLGGRLLHCGGGSRHHTYREPYTEEYCNEEIGWQFSFLLSYFLLALVPTMLALKTSQRKVKKWADEIAEPEFAAICSSFQAEPHGYFVEYHHFQIHLRSISSDGVGGHMA